MKIFELLKKPLVTVNIGSRHFQPSLLAILLLIITLPILIRLGIWQVSRAQEKKDIIETVEQRKHLPEISLDDAMAMDDADQRKVVFLGEALSQHFVVIDNQKQDNQLGYEILGVFQPENSDKAVIVSRGWLPRKDFYQKVPDIPEFTDAIIKGRLYFSKGDNAVVNANAVWEEYDNKSLIGAFDMKTVEEKFTQIGYDVEPFIVRQNADESSPFVRNWSWLAGTPQKHIAYAVQWFAMALAVFIIFLIMTLKRKNTHE